MKNELKSIIDLEKYIMVYSGIPKESRATAGMAVLLNPKWKIDLLVVLVMRE